MVQAFSTQSRMNCQWSRSEYCVHEDKGGCENDGINNGNTEAIWKISIWIFGLQKSKLVKKVNKFAVIYSKSI